VLVSLLPLARVHAATPEIEYHVKAAFLLNLTRFVEWPAAENGDSPISICILGEDPFGETIEQIVAVPPSCQVLYVGRTEPDIPALFASLPSGVLTVGEGDDSGMEG
jgi:hypothetical protein